MESRQSNGNYYSTNGATTAIMDLYEFGALVCLCLGVSDFVLIPRELKQAWLKIIKVPSVRNYSM